MEEKQKNQTGERDSGGLSPDSQFKSPTGSRPLVLASASPRRAEILRMVGWPFEIHPVDIDESRREGEAAANYVERLAREKAEAAAPHRPGATIVGADTVVVTDQEILSKPRDEEEARRMVRLLNGRWHQVLTGVAVIRFGRSSVKVRHETTEVRFAEMSEQNISWYVATGEPMDKAGAYAIQGQGSQFIEEIKGDYFNVVGLPIRLLYELLHEEEV